MFNHESRTGSQRHSSSQRASLPAARVSGALACAIVAFGTIALAPLSALANAGFIEKNLGQTSASVDFVARAGEYTGLIARDTLVLISTTGESEPLEAGSRHRQDQRPTAFQRHVAQMQLIGAQAGAAAQSTPLSGRSHYLKGASPEAWIRNVEHVSDVRYEQVYPGIDLLYTWEDAHLRYDFVVAPNADPSVIKLAFVGASDISIGEDQQLQVKLPEVTLNNRAPYVYQHTEQGLRTIDGHFEVAENGEVSFALTQAHDPAKMLVIDPVIEFTQYMGGSGEDIGNGLAVNPDGTVWVTGTTDSLDFSTIGEIDDSNNGGIDVFLTRLSATGAVLSATYLGGSEDDIAHVVAVDSTGNPHIGGYTLSSDFPSVNAAQPTFAGAESNVFGAGDGFVAKLNANGDALVYATFIGGEDLANFFLGFEWVRSIFIDDAGNAWVAGETAAPDFPATTAINGRGCLQDEEGLRSLFVGDAFVAKYTPAGALDLSFCYGAGERDAGRGISVDGTGNIYLSGFSRSDDFPTTAGAVQETQGSTGLLYDAFAAKFDALTLAPQYATLIGGNDTEFTQESALGSDGSLYLVGVTGSPNFPTTAGAFQTSYAGPVNTILGNQFDAVVLRLSADGSNLLFSTFLGGNGEDNGWGLAVTNAGYVHIASSTESADFPTVAAVQAQKGETFGVPVATGTDTALTHAIAAERLFSGTGDDLDMYVVAANDGQNVMHRRNDADGSWSSANIGPASGNSNGIAVGLTDGFFPDLVVANDGSPNHYYVNDETSGFNSAVNIGAESDATRDVAIGSFTGSSNLDIVVANYNQANRLYAGPFSASSAPVDMIGAVRATTSVAIGDVNGDLFDDIVFGNQNQSNRVYTRNAGGAGYGLAANITADANDTRDVALGDVNGDGFADIVAGNYNQPNRLYLNDGAGGFPTGTDIGTDVHATTSVLFAAVDRDDTLDLIVTGDDTNLYYLNDGAGNFTLAGMIDLAMGAASDLTRVDEGCAACFPYEYEVFAARAGATNLAYAHQPFDLYVSTLTPDGSALAFSSFVGGDGDDTAFWGLDLDTSGNAWVAATTNSTFFPAAANTYAGGKSDVVVVKIAIDMDVDGVPDTLDNCTTFVNPAQQDTNGDGFGNRCDADLDNDDTVNFTDLTLLKAAFFSTPGSANWNPDADFDSNNTVDFTDLSIMKGMFFQPPGPNGELLQ